MFIDRVVRYVGQYYVELGGVDALTFTAGIGENAANVREAIIDRLAFMGIKLDAEKNELRDDEVIISSEDSTAKVLKVATNEELMIARDVQTLQAN
jgi:acetate kinase